MAADIEIQILRDEDWAEGLAADWNDLLARSSNDSVFLSWEWVSAWWDVFGDLFEPHVIAARTAAGELVGLAPLMIARGERGEGRQLRALMLMGQRGDTLAEHLDLIIANEWRTVKEELSSSEIARSARLPGILREL